MSNQELLISEPPLQVLPTLAAEIGINEAVILQQLHYWLHKSKNIVDGYKWVYNSIPEWHKQFFWIKSETTIKKCFADLEKRGLLIAANYNKAKFDRTKWYRIDYDALEHLSRPSANNWPTIGQELTDPTANSWPTNTNRLPETTTRDTNNNKTTTESKNSEPQKPDQNQKPKFEDPVTLWRQNTPFDKPSDTQQILDGIQDFINLGASNNEANGIVSLAMHQTLNSNAGMNYLNTILRNWRDSKVATVEMAQKAQKNHQRQNTHRNNYGQTGTPSTAKQTHYDLPF